MLAIKLRIMLW